MGALNCGDDEMFDAKNAAWIISEMEKPQEKPFFLAYGLTKPHLDWRFRRNTSTCIRSKKLSAPVKKGDLSDLPVFGKKEGGLYSDEKNFAAKLMEIMRAWSRMGMGAVQAYLATISFADAQIGRVLDSLDRSIRFVKPSLFYGETTAGILERRSTGVNMPQGGFNADALDVLVPGEQRPVSSASDRSA